MKKVLAIFALGLTMMTAAAQSHNVSLLYGNKTFTDGEQAIVDQYVRIWDLMVFQDTKTLSGIFYPNVIFLGAEGYCTADAVTGAIDSGKIRYKKICVYDIEIRAVGQQAMVYSTITILSEQNGKEVVTPFYVTSLFLKNKGQWQLGSMTSTYRTEGPDGRRITISHE